jgi:hypothetical protein
MTAARIISTAGQATQVGRSSTRISPISTRTSWTMPRSTIEMAGISGSATSCNAAQTAASSMSGARAITTSHPARSAAPS